MQRIEKDRSHLDIHSLSPFGYFVRYVAAVLLQLLLMVIVAEFQHGGKVSILLPKQVNLFWSFITLLDLTVV